MAMEEDDNKKKLNDDLVVFMGKRSETCAPRYTARLKTYFNIQRKQRRASAAHQNYELRSCGNKKDSDLKDKSETRDKRKDDASNCRSYSGIAGDPQADDERGMRRRAGEKGVMYKNKLRSPSSRTGSIEPTDRCGGRRKRRRSCGRRRRRRRSCRRKRRRRRSRCRKRRRRRSCRRRRSRRRRRRSCRRRRRSCRRKRRRC